MQKLASALVAILALSGCDTVPARQSDPAPSYAGLPTDELWVIQETTGSKLSLLSAEAELGVRGQSSNGASYLGKRTAGSVGQPIYVRSTTAANSSDKDCADFRSAAEAQRHFLSVGGPVSDPDDLDRDGDGHACEWGVTVQQVAATFRAPYRAAAPVKPRKTTSYSSGCYTGPRGGRYTITSSGAKDYGGC
jgi:hypothetical protein